MSEKNPEVKSQLLKGWIVSALWIFLVPVVSLIIFSHIQGRFDALARDELLETIRKDERLTPEDREKAIEFFSKHPLSELLAAGSMDGVNDAAATDFVIMRWMIRISWGCILSGLCAFAFAIVSVLFSYRSQQAQYWSLLMGWNLLSWFAAFQTIAQGALLVMLSYWAPAFWLERFSVKLTGILGLLTLMGAGAVIWAIFRRQSTKFPVSGSVITENNSPRLWNAIGQICQRVGTEPPKQVIAGIDDGFFVSEQPLVVNDAPVKGRSLFVCLSLLKQMTKGEADAVMAHEMAHFSGNDTLYSKRIGPLLLRFDNYLQTLYEQPMGKIAFHFMYHFRVLFELSLQDTSRKREYRADKIAAETVSPQDIASGLLRVISYSKFRDKIQSELFGQEQALVSADIFKQIEMGFKDYAQAFAASDDIGELRTSHPFDSHPSVADRLAALQLSLDDPEVRKLATKPGDGAWFDYIDNAGELEASQWKAFEDEFRSVHEKSLPYRYLPETDEELEIVQNAFPAVSFVGRQGELHLTHSEIQFSKWTEAVPISHILSCQTSEQGMLNISYKVDDKKNKTVSIPVTSFRERQNDVLNAIASYYGRYLTAKEHQARKLANAEAVQAESSASSAEMVQ